MTDITIQRLSVTYPIRSGNVAALQEVSFSVQSGSFVALVGPSGCGKTTLLRAVGGLLTSYEGTILLGEHTPDEARRKRMISLMLQQSVLLPWLNIRQNVEVPLRIAGRKRKERRSIACHFLETVGLGSFTRAYPHQLSGGMQQRAALARALSFAPAVLLMDEPFGALDEMTREQMNAELLRIWQASRPTVLFVTHSLSEAVFLADRVIMLSAQPGRVVADTPILLPRPRTVSLFEQDDFLRYVAELRRKLRS
jgi:NitT/TauT family transport system ATP-binding protein